MALTPSEISTMRTLHDIWQSQQWSDELNLRYYTGRQRVEQLGLSIPPAMRRFLVITNWPRVVVDTMRSRMRLRSFMVAGEDTPNELLQRVRRSTNFDAHLSMFNTDLLVYGRGFMSCGKRENGGTLIRAESPRQIAAEVDVRLESMTAAGRFYGTDRTSSEPMNVTLYKPEGTLWAARGEDGRWVEVDRDPHRLDRVPMVMHLNRRMSGSWVGESEMTDIIPITDAAARSLTNLQFTQEAHGFPRKWMTGVSREDFVDEKGKPRPAFEAYIDAIHTLTNAQAKIGQLDASDLKNFETAMNIYGSQASIVTGFPSRFFGHFTANPPNEASMKADESTLTASVEGITEQVRVTLGWLGGLAWRMETGEWLDGNQVDVDWHDASTPTVSQREDALSKRRAAGVLSREGYWDELGWSEPRKAKERAYFAAELNDPTIQLANSLLNGSTDAALGNA